MKILVINAGSSSLKYQLFDMSTNDVIAKGLIDRIGIEWSILKHKWLNDKKYEVQENIADHKAALQLLLKVLVDKENGVLENLEEIKAIGHRVVHGGENFSSSILITPEVLAELKALIPLAPLHNPANIMWIESVQEILPGVPNIAVFDTAFHQTMDPAAFIYPIPYKYYEKYKVRKYGFHGTSHKYVSQRAAEILGKKTEDLKTIVCHVGNGASVTAIKYGKVVDTSMGMTPLEGLVMGTRCGDLDPAIVHFLQQNENLTSQQIDTILNKESWVLWISGVSSDMREIEDGHIAWNVRETLALEIYVRRIVKYIGSYVAILDGCDVLAFTAGTLENSAYIRKMIVDRLLWLWVKLADETNNFRGEERTISTPESKTTVMVVPTNEEYMIAKDTFEIVSAL